MKEVEDLQDRMISTYFSLRFGMILIALSFPIVIVLWGKFWHVDWQNSISAYYFAPNGDNWIYSPYPTRALFSGILSALGAFLYLYKGFTSLENWLLNIAGASAIVVAVSPMYPETGYIPHSEIAHYVAAVTLFACIGLTALFCNEATLKWVTDPQEKARFKRAYRVIGAFMIGFPLVGIVLAYAWDAAARQLFWIEAAGIWAFSAYWITKDIELRKTQLESHVVKGTLPQAPPSSS